MEDDDYSVRHDRLKQGDYVMVKLQGLKNTAHFVARMTDNSSSDDLETEVTYFATKSTRLSFDDKETVRFVIPEIPRTFPIDLDDTNEETA